MSKVSVCTIIAKNYFPYAEILAKSYKKQHPEHNFYVVVIDDGKLSSDFFTTVSLSQLKNIPNLRSLLFKYDILELSTAVKPFMLEWMIKKDNPDQVMYIDPDIYIFKKLSRINKLLKEYDCVLIPHITTPPNDNKQPNEWDYMGSGYYNLGYAGFSNNKDVLGFLTWWQDKLAKYCFSDPKNFMFTDQKWMDFAPSYLNTYILREPGYDVAYWNLHEYINKEREIYFFHYSGLDYKKGLVSKYQNRFDFTSLGSYKKYFDYYIKQQQQYDFEKYNVPYKYNFFDNKVEISNKLRKIYNYLTEIEGKRFKDPFVTRSSSKNKSFYEYLLSPFSKEVPILNIFAYLYKVSDNIQQNFPNLVFDEINSNTLQYINWAIKFSNYEYKIDNEFIVNQQKLFSNISLPSDINISSIISSLLSDNNSDSIFIKQLYSLLLHREADREGLQKNLKLLRDKNEPRELIVYRLVKSQEFIVKNSISNEEKSRLLVSLLLKGLLKTPFNRIKRGKSGTSVIGNQKNTHDKFGINISGYFDTESGVGESARGIVKAVKTTDISFNINLVEQAYLRRDNNEFINEYTTSHEYSYNLICVNADQVNHVIANILNRQYLQNKYNIGYWYWESDIFPKEYFSAFRSFNEIWVASDYLMNIISRVSPVPVIKIPPSFSEHKNVNPFNFSKYNITRESNDFIFLNIFDSSSFPERKNIFGTIESFNKFKKESNTKKAKLIIKTTNLKAFPEIYTKIKSLINNKDIYLLDGYLEYGEVLSLIKSSDAYISLHRSEGLGIPIIEAMLLGRPVVATAFSGNMDFCNFENSYLVKYTPYRLKKDYGPYPKNTLWADPDTDEAAKQMHSVFSNKKEANIRAIKGKETIITLYGPRTIGKLIKERMEIINI